MPYALGVSGCSSISTHADAEQCSQYKTQVNNLVSDLQRSIKNRHIILEPDFQRKDDITTKCSLFHLQKKIIVPTCFQCHSVFMKALHFPWGKYDL